MSGIAIEKLRRLQYWNHLDEDLLALIASKLRYQQITAGRSVFDPYDDSRDTFFVLSGHLRVTTYSAAGREVIFQDLYPGDLVGMISTIMDIGRAATLVALTDVELAIIDAVAFRSLLREHPDFSMAVMQRLCRLVRTLNSRIQLLTSPVAIRVYGELFRLAGMRPVDGNVARLAPPPKHVDIAHRINTHREAVTRTLGSLQRQGIVCREKGALVILDLEKLRQLAESNFPA